MSRPTEVHPVLRAADEADLPWIVDLETDPETRPWILPWTLDRHRAAWSDPDLSHHVVELGGVRAGFVLLAGLEDAHGALELRRLVVAPELRGRGVGRAALRAVRSLAFERLGVHRLWLDVKTTNQRARDLYASEGFRHEGTLRECLREGDGWTSLAVMAVLATDP